MTSDIVAPAAVKTTVANGHGDALSTAVFKALLIGSVGVVDGDIGERFRLTRYAKQSRRRSRPSGIVNPQAGLGVVSLILWALIIVVTLKIRPILLRADNHGEGGNAGIDGACATRG